MFETPRGWPESLAGLVSKAVATGRPAAIRAALTAIRELPIELRGRPFGLGICRTFTIEPQLDALLLALATLPCSPSVEVGDLENIEQLLLDPRSPMLAAKHDALLVLWRLEELHPRLAYESDMMTIEERDHEAGAIIGRIERLCGEYSRISDVPLFLSTLPDTTISRDVHVPHGPRRAVLRVNQTILDMAARYPLVHVFDFSGWAARVGSEAFDLKLDLFARQPIASRSLMSFAGALADGLRPLLLPPAKVLALDLDNVLWGGVVGEDGVNGLRIGHDFPGNIYRRIQQVALALRNRGVLLVLLSKNNLGDVEEAFAQVPGMPLKLTDFAATRVNWLSKSENLREVARELNLGLDSVVFLDDQAFEREQMRFDLPEVRVLEASEDPLRTLRALVECRMFDVYRVNDEDRRRTADYAAQAQRRDLELRSEGSPAFLHTLELKAEITRVGEATIPRVVQMLNKTNQFNVTTRRHTEAGVRRMLADAANILFVLSLGDRFGDQGIVGLAIALGDRETGKVSLDTFLFSCRAIGRGAEEALWSGVVSSVSRMQFSELTAEYHRTDRNQQVSDLFDRLGLIRQPDSTADRAWYTLDLPSTFPVPGWIQVTDRTLE